MEPVLAYITAKDKDEALALGRSLLEQRLAACVNILPSMHALYWWEGKIESAEEAVLLTKTDQSKVPALIQFIQKTHSYAVPCVLVLPVIGGSQLYLEWLEKSLEETTRQ